MDTAACNHRQRCAGDGEGFHRRGEPVHCAGGPKASHSWRQEEAMVAMLLLGGPLLFYGSEGQQRLAIELNRPDSFPGIWVSYFGDCEHENVVSALVVRHPHPDVALAFFLGGRREGFGFCLTADAFGEVNALWLNGSG